MIHFQHNNNNDSTSQCSGTSTHTDRISFVFIEKSPKCSRNKSQSTTSHTKDNIQECQLCYMKYEQPDDMYTMSNCKHTACRNCLESYLTIEITESRTDIGELWTLREVTQLIFVNLFQHVHNVLNPCIHQTYKSCSSHIQTWYLNMKVSRQLYLDGTVPYAEYFPLCRLYGSPRSPCRSRFSMVPRSRL